MMETKYLRSNVILECYRLNTMNSNTSDNSKLDVIFKFMNET